MKESVTCVVKDKKTWKEIFERFKSIYPNLSKNVLDYRPGGYLKIEVWFKDGSKLVYDDVEKRARWVKVVEEEQ